MLKRLIKRVTRLSRRTKIIVLLIVIVFLFIAFRGRGKTTPLSYASVTKGNITSQVSASGILSGKNTATLRFLLPGKLNYFPINVNQSVSRGQVVASLDSTTLNASLQEALNNRRNTQAALDNIYDSLKGNASTETFAQKSVRTSAEVANDNAWDMILATRRAMQDSVLYSPISGVVVSKGDVSIGQNVGATDVIAQVVDFSEKDFLATVDESDIGKIQVGQDAQVTLNAYGETIFNGTVVEISGVAQTQTTGGVSVEVKIRIDDQRVSKIYGLNGQANIITSTKKDVLIIPQDSLIDDTHVYVKGVKGSEKREIETGIKSDTNVEVITGLSEGDQVVTNPQAVR